MLASAAAEAGANEALVAGDERLGYGDYESCVAAFAGELMSLGATGERVALVMGNSADICIALFATHAARAVAVPLNPLYTERELRAILADARPRVLIHDEAATAMATLLAGELGIAHRIAIEPTGRRLTAWRGQRIALPPLPSPDDLATLQYTGGTTGRSKGVCLSHRAIAINIAQREALLPTRTDIERLLCVMPLFHVYAIAMCLHNMVACRGSLIILPRFQPQEVLDLIRREQVTIFAGSPTLFTGLMNHEAFADADFSSLHLSYSAARPRAGGTGRRVVPPLGVSQWCAGRRGLWSIGGGAGDFLQSTRRRAQTGFGRHPAARHHRRDRRSGHGQHRPARRRARRNSPTRPAGDVGLSQPARGDRHRLARRLAVYRRHRRVRS